jgi:hypothetical protein
LDSIYPGNASISVGDRGRALFLVGRTKEARRLVREAVALDRGNGASKDLCHFCNLVTLARIEEALEHEEEVRECTSRASMLEERLRITLDHPIDKVREDLSHLRSLNTRLAGKGEIKHRMNALLERHLGAHFSLAQVQQITEELLQTAQAPGYEFPWNGLEDMLADQGDSSIRLFGYGSLLNLKSAAQTLRAAAEGCFIPAIAFGVVRLFNFEMPESVRIRTKVLPDQPERALLNVLVTGFFSDGANGLLFDVAADEINHLRVREIGCDLRPVVCVDWRKVGNEIINAYILSGPPDRLWQGQKLTNSDLKPHSYYLSRCTEGAAAVSESFLQFWLDTTYLGDGETLLSDQRTL